MKNKTKIICVSLIFAANCLLGDGVWIGKDKSWSNSENWDNSIVPSNNNSRVVFDYKGTDSISKIDLDKEITVRSILFNPGKSYELSGNTLTVDANDGGGVKLAIRNITANAITFKNKVILLNSAKHKNTSIDVTGRSNSTTIFHDLIVSMQAGISFPGTVFSVGGDVNGKSFHKIIVAGNLTLNNSAFRLDGSHKGSILQIGGVDGVSGLTSLNKIGNPGNSAFQNITNGGTLILARTDALLFADMQNPNGIFKYTASQTSINATRVELKAANAMQKGANINFASGKGKPTATLVAFDGCNQDFGTLCLVDSSVGAKGIIDMNNADVVFTFADSSKTAWRTTEGASVNCINIVNVGAKSILRFAIDSSKGGSGITLEQLKQIKINGNVLDWDGVKLASQAKDGYIYILGIID